MTKNRMYLIFKPTNHAVYLGKRMGWGWYDVPNSIKDDIESLFFEARDSCSNQDDFMLKFESDQDFDLKSLKII